MKLNKIIYGILCLTTLNACSDQMEYKEYSNYGADYVKRTLVMWEDWWPIYI